MARIRLLCEAYGEQVRPRVIVSSIEHPAVLESVRWMERWFGCEVVEIPVDHQVHIDLDALSLSGHKFGTPKGLGALLLRSRVPVEPLMSGGGQERSLRSGTQNVAGAVALAVALRDSNTRMHEIGRALVASRDRLIDAVLRVEPRAQLTGDSQRRLPDMRRSFFRDFPEKLCWSIWTLGASLARPARPGGCRPSRKRLAHCWRWDMIRQ